MTTPPESDGSSDPEPVSDLATKPTSPPENVADLAQEAESSLTGALLYGLSLPERTARSVSAVVGGLVNESAARLIPKAFRSSRSYVVFVQRALDMMIHDVGGVENANATEEEAALAQKAVGGLLDVAGTATLHMSPMTVLAVFSDLAYGSSHYLKQLSEELKREGIIDEKSSIDHVSDLVDALHDTSGKAVDVMDAPPVNLTGLSDTIAQVRAQINTVDPRKLLPQSEVERIWKEMESAANEADASLWDVSATMTMFAMNRIALTSRGALSTITVAGNLFDEHIIGHYGDALSEIATKGLYATLAESSRPYLAAVWENFEDDRETWTEELLTGRMIGRAWSGVRGWWSGQEE